MTVKGIISTDKTVLEAINKKINDGMLRDVQGYSGSQWGLIVKHLTKNEWILFISEDSRNPRQYLTASNKLKHVEVKESDYYVVDN